ncbi:MerR family transcriptional regulator [Catenuloplanes sp. NPDC051500]|uniref:MerR family transcriptional regulator n=1 Tax=Catenuloplanes sp. NPDC051500 TaxID=3363959 RepID=UPI0037A1E97B
MTGASQDFLRRLEKAKLFTPFRSAGGHRRYSRHQMRLAARAREIVSQGIGLEAACQIVLLENRLQEVLQSNQNQPHRQQAEAA